MFAYFRAPVSWWQLARRTVVQAVNDGCPGMSAQLAFYFFIALFPGLVVLIALLDYLPLGPAVGHLLPRSNAFAPHQALSIVQQQLQSQAAGPHAGLLTLAVAAAVWSSSSAMKAVIYTLNRAYDIDEWRPWWVTRLLAIGLTLAFTAFVVLALGLIVGGTLIGESLLGRAGLRASAGPLLPVAQWAAAFALIILAVDLVYHLAPNADTEWVWVSPGSLVATALWLASSLGLKTYLHRVSNLSGVYGTFGGVVVLLFWMYLGGLSLLVGAEVDAEIDKSLPSHDTGPQTRTRRKKIGPAAEKARAR